MTNTPNFQRSFKYIDKDLDAVFTQEDLLKCSGDTLLRLKEKMIGDLASIDVRLLGIEETEPHESILNRQLKLRCVRTHKSTFLKLINLELSRRSKAEKQKRVKREEERSHRFETAFIQAAREYLPSEVFDRLVAEARESSG